MWKRSLSSLSAANIAGGDTRVSFEIRAECGYAVALVRKMQRNPTSTRIVVEICTPRAAAVAEACCRSAAIPFIAAFYRGDRSSITSCVDAVQHQYGILPSLVRYRRREGLADERALQTIETSRFACNHEILENGASRSRSRFLL